MFRNPDLIAPLTPRGAAQPLAPIDLTSDDLRIPIGIAALAVAVGALCGRSPHHRDRPPSHTTSGGPGNLIILQDEGLDRETATAVYSGAARLVPSASLE